MMFFFDWEGIFCAGIFGQCLITANVSRLLLLKVNLACFFLELSQGQDDGMADSLPFTSLRAYLQHRK